ncbi:MAG TPA: tetratricopeptide repeat protein, partial [Firmicutes bacterium]|nr:tetratricopeptide repeat protein [Bacillota bacterium]
MKKNLICAVIVFLIFVIFTGCPKQQKHELRDKTAFLIIARVIEYLPEDNLLVIDRGSNDYFDKVDKKIKVLKNHNAKQDSVNIDWYDVVAIGSIFEVFSSTSTVKLETRISEPAVNDIITTEIKIDPPIAETPLFSLWLNGINFTDLHRKGKFISTEMIFSRNHSEEYKKMLKDMREDLIETALEYEDMVKTNFVKGGKFDGLSYEEAIFITSDSDIDDFLNFVKYYPGKYLSRTWKFNELYMSWIISETPDAKEDILRDKALPHIKLAREHLAKSELNESESALKEALKIYPNSPEAKELMENIRELNDLLILKQENPENLNIVFRLGELYYAFGDIDKSITEFRILEKKNYKKGVVLFRIGKNYFQKQDYDRAIESFKQAKTADPDLDYLDKWIRISASYKDIESDIKYKSESYFAIAKIFFDDEVFDSASYYYRLGLELEPTNLEALAMIRKIKNITDGYQYLEWAKTEFTQNLDYENGIEYLVQALELFSEGQYKKGEVNALSQAGDIFQNTGNMYLAFEFYTRLLKKFPDEKEGHIGISSTFTLLLDFQGAADAAETGLKLFPEDATLNNYMGFNLRKMGRFEEAIPYLVKARDLDRNFFAPVESLLICYVNLERYEEAQEVIGYISENFKNNANFKIYRFYLEKILELKDKTGRTREEEIYLFIAYYHLSAYSKTIAIAEKIDLVKETKDYQFFKYEVLGKAHYFTGEYNKAIEYFQKAQTLRLSGEVKNFELYSKAILSKNDRNSALLHFIDSELAKGEYFNAYVFAASLSESEEKISLLKRILPGLEAQRFYKQGERFRSLNRT